MKALRWVITLALAAQPIAICLAAAPIVVGQLHRAFSIRDIHLHRGESIEFSNTDEFIHHLYVDSPTFKFNSGEQSPGKNVEVQFPLAGTFEVHCEIHPRMQLNVKVE